MFAQQPAVDLQDRRFLTFVLGVLTAFGAASIDMYLPSLPAIGQALHTSAGFVQLTLATFMIGMGVGNLIYGPASDRFGRRRPLLFGICLYTCASIGCAFAPSIEALIAMRLLQALGAAAGPVIARAIVRDLYTGRDVARVLSLMMLVMGAVPILAPLAGGSLLTLFGWRSIFGVLALFGLVAGVLTAINIPDTRASEISGTLGGNVRILIADPTFVSGTLVGAFAAASLFTYLASVSFLFMTVYSFTPREFALVFGLNAAAFIAASQLNRWLLARYAMTTLRNVAVSGLCIASSALAVAVYVGDAPVGVIELCVLGVMPCIGMVLPNCTALALTHHASRAGVASSVIGATHFALSGPVMSLIAALEDGTARPMATVLPACAFASLASIALGARKTAREPWAPTAAADSDAPRS